MSGRPGHAPGLPAAALLQLVLAVVLLGGAWPVTKLALMQGAGPAWFALGRAVLAGIVTTGWAAAAGVLHLPPRRNWPAILSIGLLQLAAFFTLAHAAVAWVPAGRTAILSNATLIWTVPITVLILRQRVTPRRWLAALLGLAGVIAFVGPWAVDWTSREALLGNAFLLGASLCWAMAMTLVQRHRPLGTMLELLPWTFGLASIALLPLALRHPAGVWPTPALLSLALVGLVMAPLGTWCIVQAQAALPLIVSSVGFLLGPALGLLLSAAFLGEQLSWGVLIGTVLILGGAAFAASGR